MKQKKALFLLTALLFTIFTTLKSQTLFWTDDFEGTSPSSGTRTPENNGGVGGPPFTSYFCRTPANGTVSQAVPFTGFQGTNYWAGEDHDAAGTGFPSAGTSSVVVREQDITWTGINISGKTGLSFTGLFAANSTNQPFDNRNACGGGATTNTDYVILQHKIDAGPWVDDLRFFTNGPLTGKYLYQETTGDSCGDGTQLLNVFQNFSANITGTGTTLTLRLAVYSEGGNEEWGVDNFRLFATATLPVQLVDFSGVHESTGNKLQWFTEFEQNNSRFEVERSNDGNSFITVGTIAGNGNSNTRKAYNFSDRSGLSTVNYYRLKQVDADGHAQYSPTIVLKSANKSIDIYPNPATDVLKIKVGSNNISPSSIHLQDVSGKNMPAAFFKIEGGYGCNISKLHPGVYIVSIKIDGSVLSEKFTKLN